MDEKPAPNLTGDEFAWYAFTRLMVIVAGFIVAAFVFVIL
jgi:hypothetical protein